jgi:hypothetical protein
MNTNIPCFTNALPDGYPGSTYLNNKIQTYADLALRVKKALGYPAVNVEVADSQLADFIDRSVEMYTRYAGYTEEYLVFDSNLYIPGVGVRLDTLLTGRMCLQDTNSDYEINQFERGECTYPVVTSTSSIETYLSSAVSYAQASTNSPSGNLVTLTQLSAWSFPVSNANKVVVSSLTSYNPITLYSNVTGLVSVSSGNVTIYSGSSYNLPSGCPTPPLTTLWGIDVTRASHITVAGLPDCELTQSTLAILSTNGNYITAKICDSSLNSEGYIPATFTFLSAKPYPNAIFGSFNLSSNKVFNMSYYTTSCAQSMPAKLPVNIEFYNVSTVESTGFSSVSTTGRYDYNLEDYRKITSVVSFEAGSFTNTNILFNIDYAIAQRVFGQTSQFSHIQHTGFDLISYVILRQWVDLTNRILARNVYIRFDRKTQLLKLIPEPSPNSRYCAAIGCYVERPIRDVINEKWVFDYTLALTKIALGNIRGKFGSISLYGGGSVNAEVGAQGLAEQKALEELLLKGGEGPSIAPFFIG